MRLEARKQKKIDKEQAELDELEKLTRPDNPAANKTSS